MTLPRLFIDADACPVKDEVYRVAGRYTLHVFVVSNSWINTPREKWIEQVVVDAGPDIADDWIAERAGPGDIVITADIPLAARCLAREARVLGPKGNAFTDNDIGGALATRALMDELRQGGVITGGPAPMAAKDRSRFLSKLDELIHAVRRAHPQGA